MEPVQQVPPNAHVEVFVLMVGHFSAGCGISRADLLLDFLQFLTKGAPVPRFRISLCVRRVATEIAQSAIRDRGSRPPSSVNIIDHGR